MSFSYHDIEHMILEIRNRPIIWDSSMNEYKNKNRKNNAWEEVCMALKGDDYNEASNETKKKNCK